MTGPIIVWGQVNASGFPRSLLSTFHIIVCPCQNSTYCRKHAVPLHFWFESRRNVFAARISWNLFVRRLSWQLVIIRFGPYFVSVGASGAIFALFGAVVIYARRSVRQSILGALVFAVFLFIINSGEGVNILAHLGGLGFGLLIGYWLATRRKPHEQYSVKYSHNPLPF